MTGTVEDEDDVGVVGGEDFGGDDEGDDEVLMELVGMESGVDGAVWGVGVVGVAGVLLFVL